MSPCGTTEQGKIVLLSQWMLDEHKKYIDYQFDSVCLLENPIALIKVDGSHDHLNSLHQMSFNVCDQCCREPTIVHEMHVVQQFNMVIG